MQSKPALSCKNTCQLQNSAFVKKSLLFLLFFLLSQVVVAQSQTGGNGVLGDSRTYKKVSGDTVRLRPSVVAKMEKEEKQKVKADAKAAKSGAGATKGKNNTAKSGAGASKNKAKNAKSGTAKSQKKSTKTAAKTTTKTTKPVAKDAKKATAKTEAKAAESTKEKAPRVEKSVIDSVQYEPPRYVLGDRVIMRGDSGHDVLSVAKILVKKLYLDEADIVYTPDGGAVYEDAMLKAILFFQEFNDFYPDGIIGRELIKALRKRK